MTYLAYPLTGHGQELVELLVEAERAGDDELASALSDLRDKLLADRGEDPAEILAAMGRDLRELEAHAKGSKSEEYRIKRRRQGFERAAETMKEVALVYMVTRGLERVEDVARRQNNSQPSVEISEDVDPSALPMRFRNDKPQVDKTAVREALEAGEELPWAKLVHGEHIRWGF